MTMPVVPVNQIDNRDLGEEPRASEAPLGSSCPSRLRSVWPKEASPASKSTSEVTLIALYDVGIHVAILAHGPSSSASGGG